MRNDCRGDQMLLAWPPPSLDATNHHWNHHRWHATNSLERNRLSCWCL